MFNLLPQKQKQLNKIQMWLRMYSVFCIVSGVVMTIGIVLMLPSYFFIDVAYNAAERKSIIVKQIANNPTSKISKELHILQSKIKLMSNHKDSELSNAILAIESVLHNTTNNIILSSYIYTLKNNVKKQEYSEITVSGTAKTREEIVRFVDSLKDEEIFVDVSVPVSSLAKAGKFTIVVRGEF